MFDAQSIAQQAQENAPQMDRTPIQPGWYKVTIAQFERVLNKNGSGEHLKVEFDLENRRKVWDRYNLKNRNEQAERIAVEQLATLCVACGYNSIQDPWQPVELIGKSCDLYIDIDGTYNRVSAIRKCESTQQDNAQKLYGTQPAAAPSATPNPSSGIVDSQIPF